MTSEDIFSPFGLLKKKFPSFNYREGQEEMAKKVEKAFTSGTGAIIEAGTGIGKSFAYLVPAFLLIASNPDIKVVIATSTITLQKQLYDKDIPFLLDALHMEDRSAILYGRSNYICKRKLQAETDSASLLTYDEDNALSRLIRFCERTDTGSRIDIHDRDVALLAQNLLSDEKDCPGKGCPHYLDCFLYEARRKAQNARITVTNHHLVLVDANVRWENDEDFSEPVILPGYTHLVFDEAHHLEAEATDLFSERLSLEAIETELDFLSFKKGEMGNKSIIEFLSPYDTSSDRFFTKNFDSAQKKIRKDAVSFFTLLKGIISRYSPQRSVLLDVEFYRNERNNFSQEGEALATQLKNLSSDTEAYLYSDIEEISAMIDIVHKTAVRISLIADILRSFVNFNSFSSTICYTNLLDDGNYELVLSPLLTGPLVKERLLDRLKSWLFCSATLSIGGNFEFFKSRLGLSGDDTLEEGIFFSPFDYKRNLMYLIPQDGRPFVNGDREYASYVAYMVEKAILSSSGGALILFTSIEMMRNVYNTVREHIGDRMELLVQDNRISRNALLKKFKENVDSSLFATSSFWEGVDAPGETLRLLVIVKLPFDVPSDPVNRARADYVNRTSDKGAFMTLTLPNAMIKMKQGVGRLIRSENDRGVVLILDGRITRKFYSHILFSSIPDGYFPEDTMLENIESKIESFLF